MSASPTNGKSSTANLVFAALGAAVLVGGMLLSVAEIKSEQEVSKTERAEFKRKHDGIAIELTAIARENVAFKSSLTEVETQFRALENYMNINKADDLRFRGLVWQKIENVPYPESAFYPSISQPK